MRSATTLSDEVDAAYASLHVLRQQLAAQQETIATLREQLAQAHAELARRGLEEETL